MQSTLKSKVNYLGRLKKMRSITKTRKNNNVIDHKGVTFVKYDIEMLRSIGQCAVYEKDETGQRHDRSYKSTLN